MGAPVCTSGWVCVWVHMCAYVCVCACVYIWVQVCVHLDAFVCVCMHVYAHWMHICAYMCTPGVHVCVHLGALCVRVCACVCMCVCLGACVHTKHLVLNCSNGTAALEASNKIKPTPASDPAISWLCTQPQGMKTDVCNCS